MTGKPIHDLLAADHDRLDALLARALRADGTIDGEAYAAFRKGLARHIGMEEKILFPAAKRHGDGRLIPHLDRLRADHGHLVALLVPPPTAALLAQLRAILEPHNRIEEEPGGVYEICEGLVDSEAAALLAALTHAPEVPMRPHQEGPLVDAALKRHGDK